jgi:LacI family transcriptional regulator, repressor for deo operon, udp, cdd, tsx, nupC, and nupG
MHTESSKYLQQKPILEPGAARRTVASFSQREILRGEAAQSAARRSYAGTVSDAAGKKDPGGRVSIVDVAERAGVSPATVSRSLRGLAKVSPDTRQRVLDAARELSYVTSLQASSLAAGPRHSVAVIVPYITRWFFSTVTAGALDILRERAYDVMLYHLGSADARDQFFERLPIHHRVRGILTLSMPLTDEHTLALRALDIPLVSVGPPVPGSPSVGIDDAGAARGAVNHLLHLKHERIGLITGEADDPGFEFISSVERRRGYEAALGAAGLTVDEGLIAAGRHGLAGGAAAMAQLLARPVLPTAIFAEYDELAIGALWALRRAGLNVPGDVSVVGIDDHEMAAMMELTTVAQSVTHQGRVAAELLLQVLGDEIDDAVRQPVVLPTTLVLRGTTAPPPTARSASRRRPRR